MEESLRMYESVGDMVESMPCKLEWKSFTGVSGHCFTVFWSKKNDDELKRVLPDSSITDTGRATGLSHMDEIKFWLQSVCMENYLLQLWTPVTNGDKRYLTTSDQPFAIKELVKGLCSYRKYCLDTLIPIHEVTAEEGHLIGPPRRVFLNGLPEVCLDVRHYHPEEYPLRHYAETCGIRFYLALPVHKAYSHKLDCVVELVALGFQPGLCKLAKLLLRNYGLDIGLTKWPGAEIEEMLQVVCDTHQLPLAQTWVSIPSSRRYKNEVRHEKRGTYIRDIKLHDFVEASNICHIKRGQGVVGKAFSSKGACFCRDISQLITNYSLVASARAAGLRSCFAISLRNTTGLFNDVYIVEFFLPNNESGDSRTLIKMVLATMKQHLKIFEVSAEQELGEKLFVEVIKSSSTDELDSFEICDLTGGGGKALDCQEGAKATQDASNLNQDLQHGGEVVDIVDSRTEADQPDNNSEILKKERVKKRFQRDYGITRADLLPQYPKEKLEDAAARVCVHVSTFKRIRRAYDMPRWPRGKHKDGPSNGAQGLNQSTNESLEGPFLLQLPQQVQPVQQGLISVEQLPRPVQPVEQGLNSNPDSTRNAMEIENESNVEVKVTYRDTMIKFYLSISSRKLTLEEEIAKRLHLSIGSFDIKYLDEEGDQILVRCDADLYLCINTMGSLGRIKMFVNLLQ